jgi:hypothetical protein
MIRKRTLAAAAAALALGSPVVGQQAAPQQMQMQTMMSMPCAGAAAGDHAMTMPAVPDPNDHGTAGTAPARAGMGAMHAAQCADQGLAALLGGPVGPLALTDAQRTELAAVLARARAEALQKLTADQRAAVEAPPPSPACPCHGAQGAASHPH